MHRGGFSRGARAERRAQARDPSFFGGKCLQCRKRQRRFDHPKYPSLCDSCRGATIKYLMSVDPVYYRHLLLEEPTAESMKVDVDRDRRMALIKSAMPKELKKSVIQGWLDVNEIDKAEGILLLKTMEAMEVVDDMIG